MNIVPIINTNDAVVPPPEPNSDLQGVNVGIGRERVCPAALPPILFFLELHAGRGLYRSMLGIRAMQRLNLCLLHCCSLRVFSILVETGKKLTLPHSQYCRLLSGLIYACSVMHLLWLQMWYHVEFCFFIDC